MSDIFFYLKMYDTALNIVATRREAPLGVKGGNPLCDANR